jgi:hypothetical protein
VSRATANVLVGILIGGCAIIVIDRIRRTRMDNPKVIAKRMGRRIQKLESRLGGHIQPAKS